MEQPEEEMITEQLTAAQEFAAALSWELAVIAEWSEFESRWTAETYGWKRIN